MNRPLVRPPRLLLPIPEFAARVSVVPKAVVPPGYWEQLEATNPHSFELVMRDIIPTEGTDPHDATLLGRQRLDAMIAEGIYQLRPEPAYYVYRVSDGVHSLTGIVAEIDATAYYRGVIRRHEHTQPEIEEHLTQALTRMRADSYPMCMTYRRHAGVNDIMSRLTTREPLLDFLGQDGVAQTIWEIRETEVAADLAHCLATIDRLYITDGHHRAAAGARVAAQLAKAHPKATGLESFNYMLAVIYPSEQLELIEYNRCVRDLGALSSQDFLDLVSARVRVERLDITSPTDARPQRSGTFGMRLDDAWYRLTVPPDQIPDDVYGSLDVVLLNNLILGPILGINDPRTSARLEYVPGTVPLSYMESNSGCGVFFVVYPTSIAQVAAIADRGLVMPPKSTWFLPKVSSGLFIRLLD